MKNIITAREAHKIRREYSEIAAQIKRNPTLQQKQSFMDELTHRRKRVQTMLKNIGGQS